MTDPTTVSALGSVLGVVRKLPVWILAGFMLAGIAVLVLPPFGGVDLTEIRRLWGGWILVVTITASALTITWSIHAGVTHYLAYRRSKASRLALRFVPRHSQTWWHLTKQQDDTFTSQIVMHAEATNLTETPVRLVRARLIHPRMRGEIIHEDISLPKEGSPYHSNTHAVPPRESITAVVHLIIRGKLAGVGRSIHATIGITDQFGDEYRLKRVLLKDQSAQPSNQSLKQRFVVKFYGLRRFLFKKSGNKEIEALPPAWEHQGRHERVDLVLNEERRYYAAIGRSRGGLGSLNVGLQSEPNSGWTTVGNAPALLWDDAQAKPVDSENAQRLMRLHAALDESSRTEFVQYLMSHLDKRSPYADVAYFSFLVLHRLGHTEIALQTARSNLAGDKVYGYSNVLGILSAIVSREHFEITPDVYSGLAKALAGDSEPNFRLMEKITLARLRQDDKDAAAVSQTSVLPASR
jgi:hypothetical protein